jgi:nucleoside-diphosphate-sugar epimerase
MQCEIAVIGGTGFIGSALVSLLVKQGRSVRVISRRARQMTGCAKAEHVCADVSDATAISYAIAGTSVVIHAGMGGGQAWADFERDCVRGTDNVGRACVTHNVRRLIYVSSVAAMYLGDRSIANDNPPIDPHYLRRNHYARGKIAAEVELERLRASCGLQFVTVRPGIVVGRNGVLCHGGLGMWVNDFCCFGWGRGRTLLPFVLVQDVAAALALAVDTPGIDGLAFNLAGDVYMTAVEFVNEMAERSMRTIRFYPRSLAILQARQVIEWALKALIRRPVPWPSYYDLKSRSLSAQVSSKRPKSILGWKPNANREFFLSEAIDSHLCRVPNAALHADCSY